MLKLLLVFSIFTFTPESVPNKAGNYPVEIKYEDGNVTKTEIIQLTVLSSDSVIEEGIAIDAKDFTIGKDTELTQDLIVNLSYAKAWNTVTGEEYPIERTEVYIVNDSLYEVVIYSFDEIRTTINVYVEQDYNNTIEMEEYFQNTFDIPLKEHYAFKLITYILLIMIPLIIISIVIKRYNSKLNRVVDEFKSMKDNVKKG